MASLDLDLDTATPEEIVAASRGLDDKEVAEVMSGPHRSRVLEAMIEHMAANFRPEKAKDLEAVIHVKLWDRPGGGYDHFELEIRDGTCTYHATPEHEEPDLTVKAAPPDLLKVISGKSGARMMAVRGKLRAQGDLKLGLRLGDLFGI